MSTILATRFGMQPILMDPHMYACYCGFLRSPETVEVIGTHTVVQEHDFAEIEEEDLPLYAGIFADVDSEDVVNLRLSVLHLLACQASAWVTITGRVYSNGVYIDIEADMRAMLKDRHDNLSGFASGEIQWRRCMDSEWMKRYLVPGQSHELEATLSVMDTVRLIHADASHERTMTLAIAMHRRWTNLGIVGKTYLPFTPHVFQDARSAFDTFCRMPHSGRNLVAVTPIWRVDAWNRAAKRHELEIVLYHSPKDLNENVVPTTTHHIVVYTQQFLNSEHVKRHMKYLRRLLTFRPDALINTVDAEDMPSVAGSLHGVHDTQLCGTLRNLHSAYADTFHCMFPHCMPETGVIAVDAECGHQVFSNVLLRNERVPVCVWSCSGTHLVRTMEQHLLGSDADTRTDMYIQATLESMLKGRCTRGHPRPDHQWTLALEPLLPYDVHCRTFGPTERVKVSSKSAMLYHTHGRTRFNVKLNRTCLRILDTEMERRHLDKDYEPVEDSVVTAMAVHELDSLFLTRDQCAMMTDAVVVELCRRAHTRMARFQAQNAAIDAESETFNNCIRKALHEECPVCMEHPGDTVLTCGHTLCLGCYDGLITKTDADVPQHTCPMCRVPVDRSRVALVPHSNGAPITCFTEIANKVNELHAALDEEEALLVVIPPLIVLKAMPEEIHEQLRFKRGITYVLNQHSTTVARTLSCDKPMFVVHSNDLATFPDDIRLSHAVVIGVTSPSHLRHLRRILDAQQHSVNVTVVSLCDEGEEVGLHEEQYMAAVFPGFDRYLRELAEAATVAGDDVGDDTCDDAGDDADADIEENVAVAAHASGDGVEEDETGDAIAHASDMESEGLVEDYEIDDDARSIRESIVMENA